jgi:hypothetical protein
MNNRMKLFGLGMFLILLLGVVIPSVLAQELIPEEPIPITTTTIKPVTTTTISVTTTSTTTTTIKSTTTTMIFPDDPIEAMSVVNTKVIDVYSKVRSADLKLDFFGTEYQAGASGTIWLQLLRNYQPINDASCYVTAYYPDKSIYLNRTLMSYLAGSDGLYYYDLTVPSVQGIYMLSALCLTPSNAFTDAFDDYSKLEAFVNVTVSGGKVILGIMNTSYIPYAWYHLNENSGTDIFDSSGNGRNGTTVNNPFWIAGKLNSALRFNSTLNQYVNFGNASFAFERTQPVSYEVWFRSSSAGIQMFFDKIILVPVIRGMNLYLASGKVDAVWFTTVTNYIDVQTTAVFNDGYWHHCIITYDGSSSASGVKIYVDNILQVVSVLKDNLNGTILNPANFLVGARLDGYQFNGSLDELVVYNKTLNATDVSFRYNNTVGTEDMMSVPSSARFASGYVKSVPVDLAGDSWDSYFADYILNNGSMIFKVLDASDNVLCTGLGDIGSCAGSAASVKLYAEFSRVVNMSSPELDRWYATFLALSSEEIRGSSELHVSALSVNNSAIGDEVIIKMLMNARILNERVVNFHNHQYCIDNMTLQHNVTYEYCAGTGNCRQMADIMDEHCAYGCDYANASCKPSPMLSFVIFIIGIIIFVVAVVAIGRYV